MTKQAMMFVGLSVGVFQIASAKERPRNDGLYDEERLRNDDYMTKSGFGLVYSAVWINV